MGIVSTINNHMDSKTTETGERDDEFIVWEQTLSSYEKLKDKNQLRRSRIESAVRKEVGDLKQNADGLLLALSPQKAADIGVVRCASQWAQNSTTIFLSVKFSHRWSSPGALKLHDEVVKVSECCFNFSADGEHSQLRKRYQFDMHFFDEVRTKGWTWQFASAGRLYAEVWKKQPGVWPQLVAGKKRPNNLAVWEDMQARWRGELKDFQRASKKKEAHNKDDDDDEEDEEDEEDEIHASLSRKCRNNQTSPFWRSGSVLNLCDKYWPPRMKGSMGKSATWLVLFYSPGAMRCEENHLDCDRTKDRWKAIANKVPQVSSVKVGAVNCDLDESHCGKQQVGHLPYVRRYSQGKRKTLYGEWDIDTVMTFINK